MILPSIVIGCGYFMKHHQFFTLILIAAATNEKDSKKYVSSGLHDMSIWMLIRSTKSTPRNLRFLKILLWTLDFADWKYLISLVFFSQMVNVKIAS